MRIIIFMALLFDLIVNIIVFVVVPVIVIIIIINRCSSINTILYYSIYLVLL